MDYMVQARASEIFPGHERRKAYEIMFQHLGLELLLLHAEEEEAIQLQEYYDRMMQQLITSACLIKCSKIDSYFFNFLAQVFVARHTSYLLG